MHKIARNLNDLIDNYDEFPFIIGVAKISMLGVFDIAIRDYFVLTIHQGKPTKKYGNTELMELSDLAKRQFLSNLDLFEIVQDNKNGRVYELKGKVGYFKSKIKIKNNDKKGNQRLHISNECRAIA